MEQFYIQTKQSNLTFYHAVPLYFQDNNRKFILYKPAGNKLDSLRIEQGRCPKKLFIKKSDELKAIRAVQSGLSLKALTVLKNEVEAGKFNRKLFEKFAYSLM